MLINSNSNVKQITFYSIRKIEKEQLSTHQSKIAFVFFFFSLLALFLILLFNYIKCISSISPSDLTYTSISHFSNVKHFFLTPIDRLSRQTLEHLSGVCMLFLPPPSPLFIHTDNILPLTFFILFFSKIA
jgi:hypothetical protein